MTRFLFSIAVAALVAGCQTSTTSNRAEPFAKTRQPVPEAQFKNGKSTSGEQKVAAKKPEVKPRKLSSLNIVDVVVKPPSAKRSSFVSYNLENARVIAIADSVMTADLEKLDNDKGWPVVVTVTLDRLYLAKGAGAFLGASDSGATGVLSVAAKGSGAEVIPARKIHATGSVRLGLGGVIGMALVGSEEQELSRVAAALAKRAQVVLFGI